MPVFRVERDKEYTVMSNYHLFDLADYHGGLHCGQCFDMMVGGRWKPTCIEYATDWYLVGIRADDLNGLRVRI